MLRSMLPDFKIEVEAMVAEGDMGMPPLGRQFGHRRSESSASPMAKSSRAGPRVTT